MAPRDNSDLPEQRVAMVVFTTVRAVDLIDGAHIVRKAIVDAFTDKPTPKAYPREESDVVVVDG